MDRVGSDGCCNELASKVDSAPHITSKCSGLLVNRKGGRDLFVCPSFSWSSEKRREKKKEKKEANERDEGDKRCFFSEMRRKPTETGPRQAIECSQQH